MKNAHLFALLLTLRCSRAAATKPLAGFETDTLRYEGNAGYVTPLELAEDLGYLALIRLSWCATRSSSKIGSRRAMSTRTS